MPFVCNLEAYEQFLEDRQRMKEYLKHNPRSKEIYSEHIYNYHWPLYTRNKEGQIRDATASLQVEGECFVTASLLTMHPNNTREDIQRELAKLNSSPSK